MPPPSRPDYTQRLLQKVQLRFGEPVTSNPVVNRLQAAIQAQTGVLLSNSSLRRVFGLVKRTTPALHTLDTLATYAGYTHYQNFCDWMVSKEGLRLNITDYETAWRSFQALGAAMREDEQLRDALYPELAQTDGYWHNWMEMDYLCVHHYQGLQQYVAQQTGIDAHCHGHGWLCLAGLLNAEVTTWTYHSQLLLDIVEEWLQAGHFIRLHPFTVGRVLSAVWQFYSKMDDPAAQRIWQVMIEKARFRAAYTGRWGNHPALAHAVAESLLATGNWAALEEVLSQSLCVYELTDSSIPENAIFRHLPWLYRVVALLNTGKREQAQALYQRIQPPTEAFPKPEWDHNLWIRYWHLRVKEDLTGKALGSDALARQQNWTALCRQ